MMHGALAYLAAFLTLHVPFGPARAHLSYSYCDDLSPSGPRGWAQTKLHFASDFMEYSMESEPSNCDVFAREIEGHFSFTARLL